MDGSPSTRVRDLHGDAGRGRPRNVLWLWVAGVLGAGQAADHGGYSRRLAGLGGPSPIGRCSLLHTTLLVAVRAASAAGPRPRRRPGRSRIGSKQPNPNAAAAASNCRLPDTGRANTTPARPARRPVATSEAGLGAAARPRATRAAPGSLPVPDAALRHPQAAPPSKP